MYKAKLCFNNKILKKKILYFYRNNIDFIFTVSRYK